MATHSKKLLFRSVPGAREDRIGILLHGFGADASDLLPLCSNLDPNRRLTWILPEAPIDFADFGIPGGRAWFPATVRELTQAMTGAYFRNLAAMDPPSLRDAAVLLRNTVHAATGAAGGVDVRVLAGFSQGAMVAVETLLSGLLQPRSLLVLSSALIARERWEGLVPPVVPPFYQSHGRDDQILPLSGGEALHKLLTDKGLSGTFETFRGGHGIPEEVVRGAAGVLHEVLREE
ncbi:MAG: alpha/beta hydrolase [Spirochaetaceae bacterium]